MALDLPLNLFHCSYDLEESNQWIYDVNELKSVITILQSDWTIHSTKTTMIRDALSQLEFEYNRIGNKEVNINQKLVLAYTDCLLQGVKSKIYTPLLKRETCTSLEEKIEYYKKKRKL